MTDKLKSALDGVRAESHLKARTTQFLCGELQRRAKAPRRHTALKKAAALAACAAVLVLSAALARSVYATPVAYVDVDVNPSTRLMLNRFNRVVETYAYNDGGESVVEGLAVRNKSYGDALALLMDSIAGQGYLQNGGLVSVTLQTDDKNRERALLAGIQTGLEQYMADHHSSALVDVFAISGDVRDNSYAQGVSPAKYLAIQELIAVDPTASLENCRGHSISEIKALTREHGSHHGGAQPDGDTGGAVDSQPDDSREHGEASPNSTQGGGHHGGKKSGNSHGGHD